jgi:hypothetical protein
LHNDYFQICDAPGAGAPEVLNFTCLLIRVFWGSKHGRCGPHSFQRCGEIGVDGYPQAAATVNHPGIGVTHTILFVDTAKQ